MPLYSYHIFLFPFKWDFLSKGKEISNADFDERTNLSSIDALLRNHQQGNKHLWKRSLFKFNQDESGVYDYNEYTFFYDFARGTLYDTQEDNELVRFYEYQIGEQAYYTISTLKKNSQNGNHEVEEYKLQLKGLNLHIFNKGVGILTFNLANWCYPESDKILRINEFGRRIYPQFLDNQLPYNGETKKAFLADQIKVDLGIGTDIIEESFNNYDSLKNLSVERSFCLPNHIKTLFPSAFHETKPTKSYFDTVWIRNIMDDRMFTMCWLGNNDLTKKLSVCNPNNEFEYENNSFWYALLVCDKDATSITCQHAGKLKEYIKSYTYERWANYGTLYGLTRETFMVVSSDIETLKKNFAPELHIHLQSMYYQIVILCLVQRASILRFSGEVTLVSELAKQDRESPNKLSDRISKLYMNYIEFVNRIYFREVTAQIQGIELYDKLQEQMRLKNEVADLDKEIQELNQFAEMREQKSLTTVANLFLPASLVAAIFTFISDKNWFQFNAVSIQNVFSETSLKYLLLFGMVFLSLLFASKLIKIITYIIKLLKL